MQHPSPELTCTPPLPPLRLQGRLLVHSQPAAHPLPGLHRVQPCVQPAVHRVRALGHPGSAGRRCVPPVTVCLGLRECLAVPGWQTNLAHGLFETMRCCLGPPFTRLCVAPPPMAHQKRTHPPPLRRSQHPRDWLQRGADERALCLLLRVWPAARRAGHPVHPQDAAAPRIRV